MTAKTDVRQREVYIRKVIENKINRLWDRTDSLAEKMNFLIGWVNKTAARASKKLIKRPAIKTVIWTKRHRVFMDKVAAGVLGVSMIAGTAYGMSKLMEKKDENGGKPTPVAGYLIEEPKRDDNRPLIFPVDPIRTPTIDVGTHGSYYERALAEAEKGRER